MLNGKGVLAVVLTLALAAPVLAQDSAINASGNMAEDWNVDILGAPQPAKKPGGFSLGLAIEHIRPAIEVTDWIDTGVSDPVEAAQHDVEVVHASSMIVGKYSHQSNMIIIYGYLGLGFEDLSLTDDNNDPGGLDSPDNQTVFETGIVFELGAGITYSMGNWDIGGSLSFRVGGSDLDLIGGGALFATEEYEYAWFTLQAEAGLPAGPGVRAFFGLRLSKYEGEYNVDVPGAGNVLKVEGELDSEFGISLGVDLSSGPVSGRMELMLVDVEGVGFGASINYGF